MTKKSNKLFYLVIFINIYIIIFIFIKIIKGNNIFLDYPSSLQLIDNNEYVVVAKDGIHFYNQNFTIENITKKINFSLLKKPEDNEKVSMAQFSNENEGNILILVVDILFILNRDGEKLDSINITQNDISGAHYGLTPYKKTNNKLKFIISYIHNSSIILVKSIYNITDSKFNINKKRIEINSRELKGVYCLFMLPLNSLGISNYLLTCFYSILPPEIFSRSFNPENNYDEKYNLNYSKKITLFPFSPTYINVITDETRKKAIIYMTCQANPFWMTFDFINKFSDEIQEDNQGILSFDLHKNKLFYFNQSKEFVIISGTNSCKKFIMVFNNNYTLNYKGILDYQNLFCYYPMSFSVIYNGTNYTIISDGGDKNSFFRSISYLEGIELEEQSTEESQTDNSQKSNDIKCKESNDESQSYKLCISCNNDKQYYEAEIKNKSILLRFKECYNEATKPINFYFDSSVQKYKPCYETCRTCNEGGNGETNNCTTCDTNYIKKPGYPNITTTNCVADCFYSYYYTPYGQYKCTESNICPEEAKLYIRDLKKCTDDCNKEIDYKFQYNGQCLKQCPKYSKKNDKNLCEDENDSCTKSEIEIDLQEFSKLDGFKLNIKNYALEFSYTKKHVSIFYNNMYNIIIYKDSICIDELSINIPKINFGSCLTKVQNYLSSDTTDKIIIVLVEKINFPKKSTTSYAFFHPKTGEKLNIEEICKDDEIIMKESVISQLNNSNIDLNSVLFLTQQNINIFDLYDEFFTDICYNFESPNGKDVPLKDRVRAFYPNITLCDDGCASIGVNLTSLESICQCKFSDLIKQDIIENNAILSNTLGEVTDLLSSSNLNVLKCYKNVFNASKLKKGYGGFIIIVITFFEIILSLILYFYDVNMIAKYLYNLSNNYILFISNEKKNKKFNGAIKKTRLITGNAKPKDPPKKILRKEKSQKNKKVSIHLKTNSDKKEYFDIFSKTFNFKKKKIKGKISRHSSSNTLKRKKVSFIFDEDIKRSKDELLKEKNICGNLDMEEYLNPDIDDMEYDDAIKLDKRNFFEYLNDRLKEKQIILDILFNKEYLKPTTAKLLLLLLNIDLYFVINGLFYNEKYISELFNSTEEETFFSFFPRSISRFVYSTLVGTFISIIMDCIFIEEKKIKRIFIREREDTMKIKFEIFLNVKNIKNRYISFIFICLVISIISWYYVSCFNNSYPGVKIEWIKSSITIIFIFQILSILMAILDSILRSISFRFQSEKIYKMKQLLS